MPLRNFESVNIIHFEEGFFNTIGQLRPFANLGKFTSSAAKKQRADTLGFAEDKL